MKVIRISAIWCSSCLFTFSKWEEFKKNHPEIECVELDYDQDDITAYQITEVLPVTIFMRDEKEVARVLGEFTVKDLESKL